MNTENNVTETATATKTATKTATAKPRKPRADKIPAHLPTKELWLATVTMTIRDCEKSSGWLRAMAFDARIYYSSIEAMKSDSLVIKNAIGKGLSKNEQIALSWDKANILDSKLRKEVMDKVSKYFTRMQYYAFPPKKENVKKADNAKTAKTAKETEKTVKEAVSGSMFATKEGLIQALNACITGINTCENTDYKREAITASLQQIIKTLI